MAIQFDQQGFITGDTVTSIKRINDFLSGIRNDVSAIKRAFLGNANSKQVPNQRVSEQHPSVNVMPVATRSRASVASQQSALTRNTVTPTRDVAGRFVSAVDGKSTGGRDAAGRFTGGTPGENKVSKNLLNGMADKIGVAITSATDNLDDVDPTVKAFNEVAEPLKRGYSAFFGGGDKKDRWYKRIFGELKIFRKESSTFDKAQNKTLKSIEGNPSGNNSVGGIAGMLGGITPIVMAAVGSLRSALLTVITGVLGVVFSPIGLAIGAAATLAWGIFTDDGQRFFSDVGAKIIAGWDSVVKTFEPITDAISKGWKTVVDGILGILPESLKKSVSNGLDSAKGVVNKAVGSVKEKVGGVVDSATGAVKSSSPKTTEAISGLWNKAKTGVSNIGKMSTNKAAMIAEMDAQGMTDPKERAMLMAQVDHESGGFTTTKEKGHTRSSSVMAVSKTARDAGKPAVDAAVAQGGDAVAELMYGGRMGNTEKGDGAKYKGRGLMQLTGKDNYAAAGKDLGLDLVNHPELAETPENAAKTAMWFWKKKKLGAKAMAGDTRGVRLGVNGGTNGLAETERLFPKYLADQSVATASKSLPSAPIMPAAPAIADAPPIIQPLASNANSGSGITVNIPNQDVSQDIRDRSIAHIVTAGYSGRH